MALFANINAADLKKGDIIMFTMGSSSPGRVAPRADRCFREELANYADGMSTAMKTKFYFMNVAGNALQDITETVLTMEYNTEFNHAGAA